MKLSRLEKCKIAIKKGIKYNSSTGDVIGVKGNHFKRKVQGYTIVTLTVNGKDYNLYAHQFAWFCIYNEIVKEIDHINGDRSDNRIENLRSVTHQQNNFNKLNVKGYCYDKTRNKFLATIKINGVNKNLGRFDKEEDARKAYLKAKEKYHKYD